MKIALGIACVLAACGSKKPEPPATLANLISPETMSVMRTSIDNFPILGVTRTLIDPAQSCWPELVKKVTSAYQILLDGSSYFIVEGDVPRADLEKCIPVTFLASPKVRDDDGMLAVESQVGTAYAAWRGNFVVFGSRDQVVAAVAQHDAALVAKWEKLLPTKAAMMAAVSIDLRYSNLMGPGVADWSLSLDKVTKEPLFLAGKFVVHYKTPDDAAKGLAYIKDWSGKGKFPLAIEADPSIVSGFDAFAGAVGKLSPAVNGTELVMAFDSDQLGGPLFFAGVMGHMDKMSAALPKK